VVYINYPSHLLPLIALKAFKFISNLFFRNRGKINAEVTGRLTETLGGVRSL